ncbi:hypothetical protein D3C86_1174810 [compost metagenome]
MANHIQCGTLGRMDAAPLSHFVVSVIKLLQLPVEDADQLSQVAIWVLVEHVS